MSREPDTERDGAPMPPGSGEQRLKLLIGRVAALIGLVVALFGIVSVFTADSAAVADISGGAVALGLGVIGHAFGARRIGLAVVVLGALAVILSLAATQGLVPGAPDGKQNLFRGLAGDPEP